MDEQGSVPHMESNIFTPANVVILESVNAPNLAIISSPTTNDGAKVISNAETKPPSPRKRKLTSGVWKDFEKIKDNDGNEVATCLHCKRKFDGSSTKGTTHLRNHASICPRKIHEDIKQKILSSSKVINEANARISNFKFDPERSRRDLAKLVIKHELPFTFVEYDYFTTFCGNLQPQFKPCTRNTIKTTIMKIYDEEKDKLYHVLDKLDVRISLTTDLWTSSQTMGYACLTAHFIDDEWNLQKKILAFEHVKTPHTAEVLYKLVKAQVLNWNIDKKLCAMTLDNASTNNAMVRDLKNWLCDKNLLLSHGNFFHVQCSAHILNLIVQDGLSVIVKFIEKIRKSIAFVRKTPKRKENFKKALIHEHLSTKKGACLDVPTRWNSTFLMLESALELKKAFLRLSDIDYEYVDYPCDDEWEVASHIHQCLRIFYNATLSLSGTKYVTANLYFDDVCTVHIKLHEWLLDEHAYIQEMAQVMLLKFMKYWEHCSLIFTVACIFDPRCKMDYIVYMYEKMYGSGARTHVEKVKSFLYELYLEYASKVATPTCISIPINDESKCNDDDIDCNDAKKQLRGGFKKFLSVRSCGVSIQKNELDVYLEETHSPDEVGFDVLLWWKGYGIKFPILSKMSRDIFAIPVTSVASESAFSTGSRVIEDNRTSLLPETIQALICTQDWLPSPKKNDDTPFESS